uniref:Uncharacterized protein n=1 Tax=Picea glauca TaxID=3330 RepID=A0A101LZT7_PICGL|nr:hypothetical protein ABT39_MTgene5357 [Picea glauca]
MCSFARLATLAQQRFLLSRAYRKLLAFRERVSPYLLFGGFYQDDDERLILIDHIFSYTHNLSSKSISSWKNPNLPFSSAIPLWDVLLQLKLMDLKEDHFDFPPFFPTFYSVFSFYYFV